LKNLSILTFILGISLVLAMTSCLPAPIPTPQPTQTLATAPISPTLEVTKPAEQTDIKAGNYALLIKNETGFSTELLKLDVNTVSSTNLQLPAGTVMDSFAQALSIDQETAVSRQPLSSSIRDMILLDLPSGEIEQILKLYLEQEPDFKAVYEKLPEQTRSAMNRLSLGATSLSLGYYNSLGKYWWSETNAKLFYVAAGADGFSHLYRYDVPSQEALQLESQPLYVRDALPSPGARQVLLVKSADISLGSASISDYYLLAENGQLNELTLPELGERNAWRLHWQDEDSFLAEALAGEGQGAAGLYCYNIPTGNWQTISTGPFRAFYQVEDTYYLVDGSVSTGSTLTIVSPGGTQQTRIDDDCFGIGETQLEGLVLMLRCADGWRGVDVNGAISGVLAEPMLESRSPDGQWVVMLPPQDDFAESDTISLYNLQGESALELVSDPVRQVFWQPDSQAFYYLTRLGLFQVRPGAGSPVLLLELASDDYRQLDYAWVEW